MTYTYESENYQAMLKSADTKEKLIDGLVKLSPFADDALTQARNIKDYEDFLKWRSIEATGKFAGMKGVNKYGAILLPVIFMDAYQLQEKFGCPLGTALIRIKEIKGDEYIKQRQDYL